MHRRPVIDGPNRISNHSLDLLFVIEYQALYCRMESIGSISGLCMIQTLNLSLQLSITLASGTNVSTLA
jgi:hypothetical protein